jgi:hypothetical protein
MNEGEPTLVLPLPHLGRRLGRDESAPREEPRHTGSTVRCTVAMPSLRSVLFVEVRALSLGTKRRSGCFEYPIDDRASAGWH